MRITEIFHSIQGESSYVGMPCVFVRLTGCPLRCNWCDTEYAFHGGTEWSIDTLLTKVSSYNCPLVEVTGGEPLAQPEVFLFITKLCDEGYTVLIETSGVLDIEPVDRRAHVILDVKCPASGMADRMNWSNLSKLEAKDEVKFVLGDRRDYDWARDVIDRFDLIKRCPILMSPVFGSVEPRQLADWVLEDQLPVRFQLQIHKFIWAPDMRGV
ncbi:7-carboxy-7-deazaguanine synthase [Nitrospira sp. KM1]|uniref:7-carboxy-7-deazaguanine synthase QueE n=1 Tax=Nitrospira sp. KM1 TaxID=1936990 RepID=UPI0013A7B4A6|nr:7-carboxy-7-deazaguanine synthase QueE [Nitrospira sp. KM1]BCA55399.1 7-carboxy-7-deazaguanine synthase [Nitrospira sp. KM1]